MRIRFVLWMLFFVRVCRGILLYKDRKLALKYAEKACEMDELADCVVAAELYAVGFGGVGKNPQKVKYYTDKLCKGGVSEACGK